MGTAQGVRKAVIQLRDFSDAHDTDGTQNAFYSRSHGEQAATLGLQLLQCHTWDAVAASVQGPLGLTWPRTLSLIPHSIPQLQLLAAAEVAPAVSQTKARGTDLGSPYLSNKW